MLRISSTVSNGSSDKFFRCRECIRFDRRSVNVNASHHGTHKISRASDWILIFCVIIISKGRTFGHHLLKRLAFAVIPTAFVVGVIMTLLAALTVVSIKGLGVGVNIFRFSCWIGAKEFAQKIFSICLGRSSGNCFGSNISKRILKPTCFATIQCCTDSNCLSTACWSGGRHRSHLVRKIMVEPRIYHFIYSRAPNLFIYIFLFIEC